MVCAEYAPLAKTGGLADAIAGLSRALGRSGHDVRVLLPKYGRLAAKYTVVDAPAHKPSGTRFVEVRIDGGPARVYLLEAPQLFGEEIYAGDERDAMRFAALAAAGALLGETLNWAPDIVHCHDWHAALTPLFLGAHGDAAQTRAKHRTVLTLHNLGYQGVFAARAIDTERYPGLASLATRPDATGEPTVNFLREGLRAADLLTTVSPTYAHEIQGAQFGMGLEDILDERSDDLVGILNGVDYDVWDPRVDPFIAAHYDPRDTTPKAETKHALCEELALPAGDAAPLIGVVTRLFWQKGIDLITAVLPTLLERSDARFALLGSGDPALEAALTQAAAEAPERVSFTRGYNEGLAHRILAGSDITLVPSRYEPCGLTQLYALRFGTIPVVRATGGLADTVQHFDPAGGTGNGSVFEDADAQGLIWGVEQALGWYASPAAWARVVANAMAADFSWRRQVGQYVAAYKRLL
jgi:starch synthase